MSAAGLQFENLFVLMIWQLRPRFYSAKCELPGKATFFPIYQHTIQDCELHNQNIVHINALLENN